MLMKHTRGLSLTWYRFIIYCTNLVLAIQIVNGLYINIVFSSLNDNSSVWQHKAHPPIHPHIYTEHAAWGHCGTWTEGDGDQTPTHWSVDNPLPHHAWIKPPVELFNFYIHTIKTKVAVDLKTSWHLLPMLTQPQENVFMTNIQSKNSYESDGDLLLLEFIFLLWLLAFELTISKILGCSLWSLYITFS